MGKKKESKLVQLKLKNEGKMSSNYGNKIYKNDNKV